MINFKQWLLTEEIWQGNVATVYHRTNPENIPTILTTSWKTAGGCMYGCGLYTTFSLESQFKYYMSTYGTSLIKFKVTNLDQYIICHKSVAQQILGPNYKISDQLKKNNLTDLYTPEQIEQFDEMMETVRFSSELAQKMFHLNEDLERKAKGIIYYGQNDGYCLVKYPPIEDSTITMLGYANDAYPDNMNKMKELMSNCKKNEQGKCENPWTTSTDKISIKTLYGSKIEDKSRYLDKLISNLSDKKFYYLLMNNQDDKIAKYIEQKNQLTDKQFELLFQKEKYQLIEKYIYQGYVNLTDKQFEFLLQKEQFNLIENYIIFAYKLTDKQFELLFQKEKYQLIEKYIDMKSSLTDKQFELLLQKEKYQLIEKYVNRKSELTDKQFELLAQYNQTEILLNYVKNTPDLNEEKSKIIGNLDPSFYDMLDNKYFENVINKSFAPYQIMAASGSDAVNKLTDLSTLFKNAKNKDEIAKGIFAFKNNLTAQDIILTLGFVKNLKKVSKFISQNDLNKLEGTQVFDLIKRSKNPDEIAKFLGPENLNKLTSEDISKFSAFEDDKIISIIKHAGTLSEKVINAIASLPDPQKMGGMGIDNYILKIIKHLPTLTPLSIANMLGSAYDKNQIADALGEDNINKLTDDQVLTLITNPKQARELEPILQKYGRI